MEITTRFTLFISRVDMPFPFYLLIFSRKSPSSPRPPPPVILSRARAAPHFYSFLSRTFNLKKCDAPARVSFPRGARRELYGIFRVLIFYVTEGTGDTRIKVNVVGGGREEKGGRKEVRNSNVVSSRNERRETRRETARLM